MGDEICVSNIQELSQGKYLYFREFRISFSNLRGLDSVLFASNFGRN